MALVGFDLFTQDRIEEVCQATHTIQVPVVKRTEYQVTAACIYSERKLHKTYLKIQTYYYRDGT